MPGSWLIEDLGVEFDNTPHKEGASLKLWRKRQGHVHATDAADQLQRELLDAESKSPVLQKVARLQRTKADAEQALVNADGEIANHRLAFREAVESGKETVAIEKAIKKSLTDREAIAVKLQELDTIIASHAPAAGTESRSIYSRIFNKVELTLREAKAKAERDFLAVVDGPLSALRDVHESLDVLRVRGEAEYRRRIELARLSPSAARL